MRWRYHISALAWGLACVVAGGCAGGPEQGGASDVPSESVKGVAVDVPVSDDPPALNSIELPRLQAFPSAEGFGRDASGGRGGTVVHVTNLNTSGAGSLDWALREEYPRIIVFDVAGTIQHSGTDYLTIPAAARDVTIDGATAPGEGIEILGAELRIQASNVIVRNLRLRSNSDDTTSNVDGIRLPSFEGRIEDVIVDRCSVYYAVDEAITMSGQYGGSAGVRDITIQNTIIAHPLAGHSTLVRENAIRISFYQNLAAFGARSHYYGYSANSAREVINNVAYGLRRPVNSAHGARVDLIGNVFRVAPSTPLAVADELFRYVASSITPDALPEDGVLYASDNRLEGGTVTSLYGPDWQANASNTSAFSNSRISPYPATEVEARVLVSAGATPWARDAIDQAIIEAVEARSGAAKTVVDFGSSDDFAQPASSAHAGTHDADQDGIEDAFEAEHGVDDPADIIEEWDFGDYRVTNTAGYTAIEMYLFWLNQEFASLAID